MNYGQNYDTAPWNGGGGYSNPFYKKTELSQVYTCVLENRQSGPAFYRFIKNYGRKKHKFYNCKNTHLMENSLQGFITIYCNFIVFVNEPFCLFIKIYDRQMAVNFT